MTTALIVGAIALVSILADQLGIDSGPPVRIGDLCDVGFAIVGLFILTWVVALAGWRLVRIQDRWSAQFQPTTESSPSVD
ncbi:MAG: hypothetical protein ACRDSH_16000 [Pseudonocardiaceae bacterium]